MQPCIKERCRGSCDRRLCSTLLSVFCLRKLRLHNEKIGKITLSSNNWVQIIFVVRKTDSLGEKIL